MGTTQVGDVVCNHQQPRVARRTDEGLLDRLEVAHLSRFGVGRRFLDDLGFPAAHDVANVLAIELDLLGVGVEVPIVLADQLLGRRAVQRSKRAVPKQEPTFPILEQDDVRRLVDDCPQEALALVHARPAQARIVFVCNRWPSGTTIRAGNGPRAGIDRTGVAASVRQNGQCRRCSLIVRGRPGTMQAPLDNR